MERNSIEIRPFSNLFRITSKHAVDRNDELQLKEGGVR